MYLQIALFFCEFDKNKQIHVCVDSEIFVDHGTHLWIVFCETIKVQ